MKRQKSFRQRFFLTIFILIVYRMCSHIPLPFVDNSYIQSLIQSNGSLGLLNAMTGGNLSNMSIVALGITPFITASIVLQLLGVLLPSLAEIQKDGAVGRDKFRRITIGLSVVLGFLQSFFMMVGYGKQGVLSVYTWYSILIPTLIMTVSVFAVAFVGEYISNHLFGNGTSLILVTGILFEYLSDGQALYQVITINKSLGQQIVSCIAAVVVLCLLFSFTVWLNVCEKRIYVNHCVKMCCGRMMKSQSVIPLKLIGGSVVPVIFASSILTVPALIQMFTHTDVKWLHIFNTSRWLSMDEWWANIGIVLYFCMIIGFSYYYQNLNLNEREIADNLKRAGSTIRGVRPGKETALYLHRNMKYLTFFGGVGLCIVAFVPIVLSHVLGISNLSFLGTSIIIVVSTIDETYKKYQTEQFSLGYSHRVGSIRRKKRKAVSRL